MKDVKIIDIQYYIGKNKETLKDISKKFNLSERGINTLKTVGIENIFKFEDEKGVLKKHLINLIKKILLKNDISINDISGIYGSGTPVAEYISPNMTEVIGYEIGLRNVLAEEIGVGCAGGAQALKAVYNQIREDSSLEIESTYLLIGWEDVRISMNQTDHKSATLFSDACYVMLVSNKPTLEGRKIKFIKTMSLLNKGIFHMKVRNPLYDGFIDNNSRYQMNGPRVHVFGMKLFEYILNLTKEVYSEDQIRKMYLIPHQANKRMILEMAKRYKLNEKKIYIKGISNYGNTTNSSAFIALKDNWTQNGPILVAPFGMGLQAGVIIIN